MNPSSRTGRLAACSLFVLLLTACAGAPTPPAPVAVPASATKVAPAAATKALPMPGVALDRIAAVVNDDVILMSELDARTAQFKQQIAREHSVANLPPDDVLQKQILEQMVLTRIQLQQAASRGVTVSDDALNQALTGIAQRAGATLAQMPDKLKADGLDYNTFRADLRDQLIIQNLQQQILNDQMRITPQEVEDQIHVDQTSSDSNDSYELSQILIATPINPTPDQVAAAHKKADDIYQKLKAGADFASTAVASSDDQQALKGGMIGWRTAAQLPSLFASTITQMKAGDFTTPIQSVSGFHIVKLDDVKHSDQSDIITQTHARHILIHTTAIMNNDQAKAKLQDLYDKIKAGADFAALAQQNSDDIGSAKQGGDLGWLDPGATVPEFQAAMDKLQPGEISPPFQSRFGWHIVQVLGRRQRDQSQDDIKQKAYQAIFQRKSEDVIQRWLSELKDSAFIEYHLDD